MRSILAVLTLLVTVSACAIQPIPVEGPGGGYRPLRAYISPLEFNGPGFYVSRPAHVALFEIVPGQGTSLLFPSPGLGRMDGFVFQGAHHIAASRRYNVNQYLPAHTMALGSGPRFFFLIASEDPLDLDRVGAFGHGLLGSMGMQFASTNAYSAMERLATLVLPNLVDDGSWTTDVYVHWPEAVYDSPSRRAGLIRVRCNGYTMWVPLQYLAAVQHSVCAPRDGNVAQPGDSSRVGGETGVIEPKRRQPLPKADAETLRERITSSTQLEEPQVRRAWPRERAVDAGGEPDGVRAPRDGDSPRARPRDRSTEPRSSDRRWTDGDDAGEARSASPRSDAGSRAQPRTAEPAVDRSPPPAPPGRDSSPPPVPRDPPCNPCGTR